MLKRCFDFVSSFFALIIISPILILVMIVLRFTGEGEVFFLQERMGFKNRPFNITKFATMLKSAAIMKDGDYTVQNDTRVLPFGRILRKTKINELAQLWDVLRGEMSVVGPRPQVLKVHYKYPESYEKVLNKVRPGITGLGSLVFRDEERILTEAMDKEFCYNNQIIPYKVKLEQWYAENQTFLLDLQLILLTIWHVLRPKSQLVERLLPEEILAAKPSFGNKDKTS